MARKIATATYTKQSYSPPPSSSLSFSISIIFSTRKASTLPKARHSVAFFALFLWLNEQQQQQTQSPNLLY